MIRLRPSGADEVLIKRVRDWYEPGPGVFITSTSTLFSPAMLFTTGVNGAWYDPSDTTTLYRDAAGTQPVTAVEQPVGLMLDKSKGLVLGPELVTNGDFATSTTSGWTEVINGGTLNASTGQLVVNNAAGSGNTGVYQVRNCTAGQFLRVSIQVVARTEARLAVFNGTLGITVYNNNALPVGASTFTVGPMPSGTFTIYAHCSPGNTATFDNISVRELPGNHAFNASGNSANFPVLSARYNLLTKTEDFSDAVWLKINATVTPGQTDPVGGTSAFKIQCVNGGNEGVYNSNAELAGVQYRRYFWAKADSATTLNVSTTAGGGVVSSSLTTSWQLFSYDVTPGTQGATWFKPQSSTAIYIWHPDVRVANDALNQPAYQRVNTSTDYDTVGFKPYLRFNGTNQWLQTNSIDFTYGDKMFVCAGVRKLSDATLGITSEIGTGSGAGRLYLAATNGGPNYLAQFAGSTPQITIVTGAVYPAPITNVISGIGDISGDQALLRVNGTQAASSTADQGTGNYGSYPLYLGARAGSSLWFNGRLHQLVVVGKQASASEIGQTEAFTNTKTGAY